MAESGFVYLTVRDDGDAFRIAVDTKTPCVKILNTQIFLFGAYPQTKSHTLYNITSSTG